MKGVMGKILWWILTTGESRVEEPGDQMYEDYLGGYGIGARYIYDRQKPNVDPLGPDNILAFMSGPLTGTTAVTGNRWIVMGKSPKTDTWGDANCGGTFGPAMKWSGFDGIFVTGAAAKPSYILVDNGQVEIRDATDLWGHTEQTHPEITLKERHGKKYEVAWIGEAGEKQSLTAGVMNDIGRSAARSGMGAVMGAKHLKAIVCGGDHKIELADSDGLRKYTAGVMRDAKAENSPTFQMFTNYGTTGGAAASAASGDSPVRNWAGVGVRDFVTAYEISDVALDPHHVKRAGCWHCTIACSAHMKVADGNQYAGVETHRPEYETLAAAGTMTLVDDLPTMLKFNDLCNVYGMDTITAGSIVAYAMEAYERGLISDADTDGVKLEWGNAEAVIHVTNKIGKREGRIGEIFGDGVAKAAERLGQGADEFAVHVHGEEVPMHDPRYAPGMALTYQIDATPARHTQGGTGLFEMMDQPIPEELGGANKYEYDKKGLAHRVGVNVNHITNASGVCLFAGIVTPEDTLGQELTLATGIEWDMMRMQLVGERIATLRHAFNLREGLNPVNFELPKRVVDGTFLGAGPLKEVQVDNDAQRKAYFEQVGWDQETAVPSKDALTMLGLAELIPDLHGTPA